MRIECPLCGTRDSREFSYLGAADLADRPDGDAGEAAHFAYVHLRDNPAGPHEELWHHAFGCRAWLIVTRDTTDHSVLDVVLARDRLGERA